jgi:hypothetical protein
MTHKQKTYSADKLQPLAVLSFLFPVFPPPLMVFCRKQNNEINL